jgi:adenosine 3'-phospho 5'-phosphosulfate transporter B3
VYPVNYSNGYIFNRCKFKAVKISHLTPRNPHHSLDREESMPDTSITIAPSNSLLTNDDHRQHHHILPTSTHDKYHEDIYIFGFNISHLPPYMQLVICVGFMFLFYSMSGIVQEYLFVQYEDFKFGFFLTLVQFVFYSALSIIPVMRMKKPQHVRQHKKSHQLNVPLMYLILGTLMMAGVGLGNEAMNYLNYPTKILFKSSKLLLAMVIGVFITGKKYSRFDYLASICLVLGLITLYNANQSASVHFEFRGVLLIVCALASDSVAGNLQEKILQQAGAAPVELIFYSHAIGAVYLLVVCLVTGQLTAAISFCTKYPASLALMLCYCALCYLGVQFVHSMTKLYGIVATLTAASTRKVFSILLSYFIFPKPFLLSHVLAISLVFSGVGLRIYTKNSAEVNNLIYRYILGEPSSKPIIASTRTTAVATHIVDQEEEDIKESV